MDPAKEKIKHEHKKRFDNKMKKYIAWILALLTLCLLGACKSGGGKNSEPKTMAEAQIEKAQAKREALREKKGVLRVVTDLDAQAMNFHDGASQADKGAEAFQKIIEYFGGTPSGMEAQLEVLPTEESEYDMALTRMRTEIMAGSGPDVFYLTCFDGDNGIFLDCLFPNPEHAMASGFFLPLDSYIEDARFMDLDQMDAAVMEAGRYEDEQYILPMFYRLGMGVLYREAGLDVLPASWDEAAASGEEDIRALYTWGAANSPGFRQIAFSQIADNVGEKLLLDSDTLFQRTKDALDLYRTADRSTIGRYNGIWNTDYSDMRLSGEEEAKEDKDAISLFAPRGGDGDVTAAVQNWCAINSNTPYPEDAFFLADVFMSKEFLSASTFWTSTDPSPWIPLLGEPGLGCISVHKEPLSTNKKRFKGGRISAGQCEALAEARESITYAYFPSNVDRELNQMYDGLKVRAKAGEDLTDEEIRRTTDKCCSTMKMMLAES